MKNSSNPLCLNVRITAAILACNAVDYSVMNHITLPTELQWGGRFIPANKSITHVFGIKRYRCDRNTSCKNGGKGGNRTLDPGIMSAVL